MDLKHEGDIKNVILIVVHLSPEFFTLRITSLRNWLHPTLRVWNCNLDQQLTVKWEPILQAFPNDPTIITVLEIVASIHRTCEQLDIVMESKALE